MTEARIGRVVVASLHEALAHQLPPRLEFYETYLRPMGMRAGTIGLASFTAALSFLRREPDAYDPVVRQAGALAAEWTFATVPALGRALWASLPQGVRRRRSLRYTARLADSTMRGTRGRVGGPRSSRGLIVLGSPFCDLRRTAETPMCGFYAAALERFSALLYVPCTVDIVRCRATGDAQCEFAVGAVVAAAEAAHRPERMLT